MKNSLQKKRKQRYSFFINTAEQCIPENDEEQAYLFTEFDDIQEGEEKWDKLQKNN